MVRLTRQEQREETRRKLIDVARAVFARVGFDASSIDAITEEAGFSRGAFYSNFDSKDELFLELVRSHFDLEVATLARALARVASAEDLPPAVERRYRVLGEDSSWCLLTTEFQLYALRGGERAGEFVELYTRYRNEVGALVAEHFRRLGVRSGLTPREFAAAHIALAQGLALQRAADATFARIDHFGNAPLMPPVRFQGTVRGKVGAVEARLGAEHGFAQRRLAPLETASFCERVEPIYFAPVEL